MNTEKKVLAILGLVVGGLAIFLSWVPSINNLAFVFAIIGLVFGGIALIRNRKNKKLLSLIGTGISVLAIGIVILTQAMYSHAIDQIGKSANDATTQTSQQGGTHTQDTAVDEKPTATWDETTRTFTAPDGVLTINSVEKTTDYDDKPAIKVNFTLKNTSDKPQDAQMLFQQLATVKQQTANTTNSLNYTMLSSNDEDHLNDSINSGGTITGFYPLSLENETDPILISFQADYLSNTVATYHVNLT